MNKRINKKMFVEMIMEREEMSRKQATQIVDVMLGTLQAALVAGNTVAFLDFGIFEVRQAQGHRIVVQGKERFTEPKPRVVFKTGVGLRNKLLRKDV